jgi:hypothetical protein
MKNILRHQSSAEIRMVRFFEGVVEGMGWGLAASVVCLAMAIVPRLIF